MPLKKVGILKGNKNRKESAATLEKHGFEKPPEAPETVRTACTEKVNFTEQIEPEPKTNNQAQQCLNGGGVHGTHGQKSHPPKKTQHINKSKGTQTDTDTLSHSLSLSLSLSPPHTLDSSKSAPLDGRARHCGQTKQTPQQVD